MTVAAHVESAVGVEAPAPYRLRKSATFCRPPTLSDAQALVQQTGQRDLVLRWAETARQLEQAGQHCSSLAELAAVSDAMQTGGEGQRVPIEQLRRLLRLTAALASRIGAEVSDTELSSICFELCRTCQHAEAKIRNQQLWRQER